MGKRHPCVARGARRRNRQDAILSRAGRSRLCGTVSLTSCASVCGCACVCACVCGCACACACVVERASVRVWSCVRVCASVSILCACISGERRTRATCIRRCDGAPPSAASCPLCSPSSAARLAHQPSTVAAAMLSSAAPPATDLAAVAASCWSKFGMCPLRADGAATPKGLLVGISSAMPITRSEKPDASSAARADGVQSSSCHRRRAPRSARSCAVCAGVCGSPSTWP
eukprot:137799-Prymnesium_polylepis.1